jgi:tRNA(fMet)-specific endonuclease VapC
MSRYLLDAGFCVHVLKQHPPALRERFNAEAAGLCLSALTLADLRFAAERSARRPANLLAVEHFAARLDLLPYSAQAAAHYGMLRAELERGEYEARPGDILLAAQARADGLTLVTIDTATYDGMAGVLSETWM